MRVPRVEVVEGGYVVVHVKVSGEGEDKFLEALREWQPPVGYLVDDADDGDGAGGDGAGTGALPSR